MKKLVAGFASSLDGYIEGPNGEYDWIIIDKEIDFAAHFKRFDTYLFGRRTYEKIISMGNKDDGIKKYVFSKTLVITPANYTLISDDLAKKINAIKKEEGKDIALWGGAGLLTSLLDLKLVDEIQISIIPVLLGEGKPMVGILKNKVWLSLIETKTYSNSTLAVTYKVDYKSR
jgi:dihydrofolate reductase